MDDDKAQELIDILHDINGNLHELNQGVGQLLQGEGTSPITSRLEAQTSMLGSILSVLEHQDR